MPKSKEIQTEAEFGDSFILDEAGNPAGGNSYRQGVSIEWQNGPVNGDNPRNGAFVEEVLQIAKARLEFYQSGKFNCEENRMALYHLDMALGHLNDRTARRVTEGKEGTHEV